MFYDHIVDKKNGLIVLCLCVWDPWLWNYKRIFAAPEHLHLQDKYKEILSNSYRVLVLEWYSYINAGEAH